MGKEERMERTDTECEDWEEARTGWVSIIMGEGKERRTLEEK